MHWTEDFPFITSNPALCFRFLCSTQGPWLNILSCAQWLAGVKRVVTPNGAACCLQEEKEFVD